MLGGNDDGKLDLGYLNIAHDAPKEPQGDILEEINDRMEQFAAKHNRAPNIVVVPLHRKKELSRRIQFEDITVTIYKLLDMEVVYQDIFPGQRTDEIQVGVVE